MALDRSATLRMVSFIGPVVSEAANWSTATFPVGRVALSTGRLYGPSWLWIQR
jgi:hypothetical protein